MPVIRSRSNPLVKSHLKQIKSFPSNQPETVIEGIRMVEEALKSAASIEAVFFVPKILDSPRGKRLIENLRKQSPVCREVAPEVLKALSLEQSPPGILSVARFRNPISKPWTHGVAVLCGIRDPGNAGSILRSAEGAGGSVFFSDDSVIPCHPKVVKASMGSFFRVKFARGPVIPFLNEMKSQGKAILGAKAREAVAYTAWDWKRPFALLLGSEAAGLPGGIESYLDGEVCIPLEESVESLNVAAAAAILLFEAARQSRGL